MGGNNVPAGVRGHYPALTHPDVIPVPTHVYCDELGPKVPIKSNSPRQWVAKSGMLVRTTTGSHLYGTNTDDGVSDFDEVGICIESPEYVIGGDRFEEYKYRSAEPEGPGKQSVRSRPGDLDLTIYGLRKFVSLAAAGNPNLLQIPFTPDEHVLWCSPMWEELRERAHMFVSKEVAGPFLGYLDSQRRGLLGERSGGTRNMGRRDIREAHGYDVKFAMHMVRLGFQCVELLRTGRMTLPFPEPQRAYLRKIRAGFVPQSETLARAAELEEEIRDLKMTSPLPEHPDRDGLRTWVISAHRRHWNW